MFGSGTIPALAALCLAASAVVVGLTTSDRVRLAIVASLAPLQIFDVIPHITLALAASVVLLLRVDFSVTGRPARRIRNSILAIAGMQLIATLWSQNWWAAATAALTTISLLACFLCALRVVSGGRADVLFVLRTASITVALQAASTIIFRVSLTREHDYLSGSYAKFFSGTDVIRIFADQPNNVLDPDKAGGLFLNGNTASMAMAVAACVFGAVALRWRDRLLGTTALLSLAGTIATGSKTALALVAVLPVFVWVMATFARRRRWAMAALAVALILTLVVGRLWWSAQSVSGSAIDITLDARIRIWSFGIHEVSTSPLTGLGYGGWSSHFDAFQQELGMTTRPAHNFLLQAWSDGGVALVVAIGIFVGVVLSHARTKLAEVGGLPTMSAGMLITALLWVFIHGLGDNTQFLGVPQVVPFLALILALIAEPGRFVADSVGAESWGAVTPIKHGELSEGGSHVQRR